MKNLIALTLLLTSLPLFAQSGKYINPDIKCEANGREKAMKSYPYRKSKSDQKGSDTTGLAAFDEAMREKFTDSELDSAEALIVYQVLEREEFLSDESYGMPSPNRKRSGALNAEQLQKRVALKKREEGVFDVIYYKVGCGKRFHHMRLYIKSGSIIKKRQIESWQASYPC